MMKSDDEDQADRAAIAEFCKEKKISAITLSIAACEVLASGSDSEEEIARHAHMFYLCLSAECARKRGDEGTSALYLEKMIELADIVRPSMP